LGSLPKMARLTMMGFLRVLARFLVVEFFPGMDRLIGLGFLEGLARSRRVDFLTIVDRFSLVGFFWLLARFGILGVLSGLARLRSMVFFLRMTMSNHGMARHGVSSGILGERLKLGVPLPESPGGIGLGPQRLRAIDQPLPCARAQHHSEDLDFDPGMPVDSRVALVAQRQQVV
jgi:hypothetical protein